MSYRPRYIQVAGRGPLARLAARMGGLPMTADDGTAQIAYAPGIRRAMPYRARSFNYSATSRYRRNRRRGPYQALTYGSRHTNPIYPIPEAKFLDTGFAAIPVTTTAGIGAACYNGVAQGTGGSQRIGQQICSKSVSYHINVDQATTTPVSANVRIIIFWDKQPNGANPTVAQLIQGTADINAFLNVSNKERFVVLRNLMFSLSVNGMNTDFKEGHIKLNMLTTFTDAGTIPRTGGLFVYFVSDAAANPPTATFQLRFRYTDC